MSKSREEQNKSIVLEAFETLFNKRDYRSALNFWSPQYIQHSAHIPPGRDGLFELVKNVPPTMRYENQLTVAEGDFVLLHGRYSGLGEGVQNWVVVDIVRMDNGVLTEHWDVIQDEAMRAQSKSGNPMFGDEFPATLG
jgi:predicted SnoaL-like aldol condensation-catalyzing enzyme